MAVVVTRKQPFVDWIKSHDPDFELHEEKHDDKHIYLLPEKDGADWDKYVKKHFLEIFKNELEGWIQIQTCSQLTYPGRPLMNGWILRSRQWCMIWLMPQLRRIERAGMLNYFLKILRREIKNGNG